MHRPREMYELPPAEKRAIREAMLSVYYHSLGRQWQQQGAPTVLLPPDIRPLELGEALRRLEPTAQQPSKQRWWDAVWRVIRSLPARGDPGAPIEQRYPPALREVVPDDFLRELDERRRWYRTGAHLFAAALELLADGNEDAAERLVGMLNPGKARNFNSAVDTIFDVNARGFFEAIRTTGREPFGVKLRKLENVLGRNTYSYVLEFADAAAFHDCVTKEARGDSTTEVTVFPVSSALEQDTATLITTSTVTTMVSGPFSALRRAIDPQNWPISSDVITTVDYVDDAFDPVPVTPQPDPGTGYRENRLIREHAELSWGPEGNQQGAFDVVLNTVFDIKEASDGDGTTPCIDFGFTLGRCVNSTVLWDRRPGGLLIDDGYVKVTPLGVPNRWRVTRRKILKFSDRTPNLYGTGWSDAGQLLNYFAPAALSWWNESETYTLESDAYSNARQGDHRNLVS